MRSSPEAGPANDEVAADTNVLVQALTEDDPEQSGLVLLDHKIRFWFFGIGRMQH